jgi:hypothetical protein
MSNLSEVTILISQRAGEIERARDVFRDETRQFVNSTLGKIRRDLSEPWTLGRLRIDIPKESESEGTPAGLDSPFACCQLRFRKEATFRQVADIRLGIDFEQSAAAFLWQVVLLPSSKYPRLDDLLWNHWQTTVGNASLPGSAHQAKSNTILFAQRPVGAELTVNVAFNDMKIVLEALLKAGPAVAESVGFEPEV